jgi:peptide/nickel transport system substrate-binding protein
MKRSAKLVGASLTALALVTSMLVSGGASAAGAAREINEQPVSKLKKGGTLIYAMADIPDNFNTSHVDGNVAYASYVMDTALPGLHLVDKNATFQPDPNYASKIEITSEKPQTITYTLNPNAKWSDGKKFGLADMQGMWKANNGTNKDYVIVSSTGWEDIKSVKAGKGANEVVVTFAKIYPDWQGLFGAILPAKITKDPVTFNTAWATQPDVSAGPFIFSKRDDAAKTITVVRNKSWWGPSPVLDRVIFRAIPPATQLDALANGEVDYIDIGPDANQFKRAKALKDISVRVAQAPSYRHVTFGKRSEAIKNVLVRRAITAGMDRGTIAKAMIGTINPKAGALNNHVFVGGTGCYKDNTGNLGKYNIQLADQFLEKAGYTGNPRKNAAGEELKLSILIPAGVPTSALEAQLVQAMLKPLNMTVDIEIAPLAEFFTDKYVYSGNFDMTIFTWNGTLLPISSSANIFKKDSEQNFGNIYSAKVDELFAKANSIIDPVERCKLANQADALVWKMGHSALMYQRPNVVATKAKVANLGAFGFTGGDWTKVGFMK